MILFQMIIKHSNIDIIHLPNSLNNIMTSLNHNDINLLVKKRNINQLCSDFLINNYRENDRKKTSNIYIYGVSEHKVLINKDKPNINIHTEIPLRSFVDKIYLPISKEFDIKIWTDKVNYIDNQYYLSASDEFCIIIASCLFSKHFDENSTRKLKKILTICDEIEILQSLSYVFYRSNHMILREVKENNFASIYNSYISFSDY